MIPTQLVQHTNLYVELIVNTLLWCLLRTLQCWLSLPICRIQFVGNFTELLAYTARWHSPPVYDSHKFVHLLDPNCGQIY